MAKLSSRPLQPNPFRTYRDPHTGEWKVEKLDAEATRPTPEAPPSALEHC
ncbi:hypothetical protein [Synechocystis sp. LKSZ1]